MGAILVELAILFKEAIYRLFCSFNLRFILYADVGNLNANNNALPISNDKVRPLIVFSCNERKPILFK